MSFTDPSKTRDDSITRDAADWVVRWEDRERSPGAKEQSRWFSWLRRSPKHVQAYFDMADLHYRLGGIDPDNRIDVDEWLAKHRASVVRLVGTAHLVDRGKNRDWMRWTVAAVTVTFSVILWGWLTYTGGQTYRTDVGEQRIFKLADGSVINLNTQSSVKVSFSKVRRVIDLEGEGLFTVAHDASRPFYVRTHDATIRAVGTEFSVYGQADETRVAVVEGVVQVSSGADVDMRLDHRDPGNKMENVIALSAGETARVSRDQIVKKPAADIKVDIAWRHQQLVFEDAPLAEVAAEFNRYNHSQIRVADVVGRTERLSGTFDALHPQSLLLYLQKDPGVVVQPTGDNFIVRSR